MVDLNDDSINLRALQKIDDNIREILLCCGQTGVYNYEIISEKWCRKNIEGSLFFVRRSIQPEYAFVVINRLNTINFIQKITKDFVANLVNHYLMYKNDENEIYCIWFYDVQKCGALHEKIVNATNRLKNRESSSTLATSINAPIASPLSHPTFTIANNGNQFNGFGTSHNMAGNSSELLKKMLCLNNLYENNNVPLGGDVPNPEPSAPPAKPAPGTKLKQSPLPTTTASSCASNNDLVMPIAQRRSVNLKDLFETSLKINETTTTTNKDPPQQSDPLSKQNDLLFNKVAMDLHNGERPNTSTLLPDFTFTSTNAEVVHDESISKDLENAMSKIKIKNLFDPTISSSSVLDGLDTSVSRNESNLNTSIHNTSCTPSKPPMASAKITPIKQNSITDNPKYLSMEQLKKTLIHLLKDDADFLHTIHTTYVEQIQNR